MEALTEALKKTFGHAAFRPGQEEVARTLLSGRDVLAVMPTGAGKSVCYQLPAVMLPGVTLVISPLISLMKDQVAALNGAGIPAAYINSTLTPAQQHKALTLAAAGKYRLIYVAPERLLTPAFLEFACSAQIALVAVDEAHCVSQWGQDFRPSYLQIPRFIESLPARPPVGAFTATATEAVKEDIVRLLQLREPFSLTTGYDRPNLFFRVEQPRRRMDALMDFLDRHEGQSGIIYCPTRKRVEQVCQKLIECGIPATRYHAGLSEEERRRNQEDFVYDRRTVMVATNAFGMGIDKSNVSFVVHYAMPKDPESYYQEAGRAGRDGEEAECLLLYSPGDIRTARLLNSQSEESEALSDAERAVLRRRNEARLQQMIAYCRTDGCLRAFLLRYFGETAPDQCGFCGNCVNARRAAPAPAQDSVELDITRQAQMILSAAVRAERANLERGVSTALLVRMLRGSSDPRLTSSGLADTPTWGLMADVPRLVVQAYVEALIGQGFLLRQGTGLAAPLRLDESAREVLFGGLCVTATLPASLLPRGRQKTKQRRKASRPGNGLYEALRQVRTELAAQVHLPPYLIFSNATLADMALRQPRTREELLEVSGVGEVKADRYGQAFLSAIRTFTAHHN